MDPLSVAASVAGLVTMGVQISKIIYNLIYTFREAKKEMSTIASDVACLATVLTELETVLQRDSRVYRRSMVVAVNGISENCKAIFQSIAKYVSVNPQDTTSSKQFQTKIRWFFKRHRVRALQARL